jgi:GMP synthase (glutamine-hydrolysing)
VIFFVSGGVDSTVAFTLCSDALGPDRVTGVFVDTGLMRKGEREEIEDIFAQKGWHNCRIVDASQLFLDKLALQHDPEKKRKIIGDAFLQVQREQEILLSLGTGGWMLGQGTIYPDTIESGYGDKAAVIKTHHNRVPAIAELMEQGLVLEPLKEFYKDEVRDIGRRLGLPEELVSKQPFPGPGLAVRCLCSIDEMPASQDADLDQIASFAGLAAWSIPLRTVGVQGDHRSYSKLVVLVGDAPLEIYAATARKMTRQVRATNRVAFQAGPAGRDLLAHAKVCKRLIDRARLDLLREADAISHDMLRTEGLWAEVWQFPVVLVPLTVSGGETVALRPVSSSDAMTARHANLPIDFIHRLADRLLKLPGVDLVLYDVTDKPPATIEWE